MQHIKICISLKTAKAIQKLDDRYYFNLFKAIRKDDDEEYQFRDAINEIANTINKEIK